MIFLPNFSDAELLHIFLQPADALQYSLGLCRHVLTGIGDLLQILIHSGHRIRQFRLCFVNVT